MAERRGGAAGAAGAAAGAIEPLHVATRAEPARIGGKACGLVRLLQLDLPVPEAWAIPAAALAAVPVDGALPPALRGALDAFWRAFRAAFPRGRLAVRSSAVAEDLSDASFAGVYTTVLDVRSAAGLRTAVQRCLAARASAHAERYRQDTGHAAPAAAPPPMALVLQRMLAPDVAGVVLTTHPLRPLAGEAVVNAAYGLGEGVVGGLVDPDEVVLAQADGRVLRQRLGAKATRYAVGADGSARAVPVPAAQRARSALGPADVAALWRMAQRVVAALGPHQDLEFALEGGRLYLLQQRPIVGLPPAAPSNVWTRVYGDEYLSEYAMPLSHDLLGSWIDDVFLREFAAAFGVLPLLQHPPTRRHRGYAYMSGEYVATMLSATPPAQRAADMLDWFPPLWQERIRAEPFRPALLARVAWAAARDRYARLGTNPAALDRHCAQIDREVRPRLDQDYGALDAAAWTAQYEAVQALGVQHFRIIRWGMGFFHPMLHTMLGRQLERWCADDGRLYADLIGGLDGTRTTEINRAVWMLGQHARADDAVGIGIAASRDLPALRAATAGAAFWPAFDAFLAAYGHRADSREISQPRWREAPGRVADLVRAQLSGPPPPDPAVAAAAARDRRLSAEATALARAGRGLGGRARRAMLARTIATTQTYTRYRENQRFHLDLLLTHVRALVLAAADALVARGALAARDDVFLLHGTEFAALQRGGTVDAALGDALAARRREAAVWRHRRPARYLFDDVEFNGDAPLPSADGGNGWRGTAASPGVATGRVRVVRDLGELGAVEPGEIMVAANTDPAWTSVFPRLAALVTETGGTLSHGALLAREYGLPAVTGLVGACARLRTGDEVCVDGGRGTVAVVGA